MDEAMSGCVVAAFCWRARTKDRCSESRFRGARCSAGVGAGRAGAVGASAVVAGIGAVGTPARVVVTGRAAAVGA